MNIIDKYLRERRVLILSFVTLLCFFSSSHYYGLDPYNYGWEYFTISKNPFAIEPQVYVRESILHPIIVYFLGFSRSLMMYFLYCTSFFFIVVFNFANFVSVKNNCDTKVGVLFILLIVFHPFTFTIFFWMGFPDYLVFTAVLCLYFVSFLPLKIFFVIIGSLAHFPLTFVSVLVYLIINFKMRSIKDQIKYNFTFIFPSIVSKLYILFHLKILEIEINNSRIARVIESGFYTKGIGFHLFHYVDNLWWKLYSYYSGEWVLLVFILLMLAKEKDSYALRFLLAQIVITAVAYSIQDITRIYSLLSIVPFLYLCVYFVKKNYAKKRVMIFFYTICIVSFMLTIFLENNQHFVDRLISSKYARERFEYIFYP